MGRSLLTGSGRARARQRLTEGNAVAIDVGAGPGLGGTYQQRVTELGIVRAEVQSAEDPAAGERLEDRSDRTIQLQHRFVEAGTCEDEAHTGQARESGHELARTRVRRRRGASEPLGPEKREIDRGRR